MIWFKPKSDVIVPRKIYFKNLFSQRLSNIQKTVSISMDNTKKRKIENIEWQQMQGKIKEILNVEVILNASCVTYVINFTF